MNWNSSSCRGVVFLALLSIWPFFGVAQSHIENPLTETPRFWALERFGFPNAQRSPTLAFLTEAEEANLKSAYLKLPATPRYLYSGCHDRAHAIYLMLPSNLRPKLMKVWVIAPSRYTEAIGGMITSARPEGEYAAVHWGYHVAIAYRTASGGLMVIDPALLPGQVVPETTWFAEMKAPALSLWTLTDGSVYLFNNNAVRLAGQPNDVSSDFTDPWAPNGRVWNGNSFTCDRDCQAGGWIANALARDSVGVDATSGKTCDALSQKAIVPDDLLTELQTGNQLDANHNVIGTLPEGCAASRQKFTAQRAEWIANLVAHQ
jgi:hypothetical protein